MVNYSQLGQDLEIIKKYNHKKGGFFLEIGASDGIQMSNTYLLEKHYDWKGICVEPIPHKYELLCKNRPNSFCSNEAVYNESDKEVVFDIANNCNMASGISEHIDCHRDYVNSNKTTIVVRTITMNDLLEKYGAPRFIEYLSLDTEGSEYEILKATDFDKYTFGYIDVEHNYFEPRRTEIRELLLSKGYVYIRENHWDDCYKHNTVD
jgi:FkbM family methyltransferase